jgi:hypothetical protein
MIEKERRSQCQKATTIATNENVTKPNDSSFNEAKGSERISIEINLSY